MPTPRAAQLSVHRNDDHVVIELQSRLDAYTSDSTQQLLTQVVDETSGAVILDCSQIDYVSSRGVRVMVSVARAVQDAGRGFAVASSNPQVNQIFDIAALQLLFPVAPDAAAARAALDHPDSEAIPNASTGTDSPGES